MLIQSKTLEDLKGCRFKPTKGQQSNHHCGFDEHIKGIAHAAPNLNDLFPTMEHKDTVNNYLWRTAWNLKSLFIEIKNNKKNTTTFFQISYFVFQRRMKSIPKKKKKKKKKKLIIRWTPTNLSQFNVVPQTIFSKSSRLNSWKLSKTPLKIQVHLNK